jgi:hypothetical protein
MKLLVPLLLAAYTFVAVFVGVRAQVSWHDIVALGPLGVVVFAFGYCIDLLIFGVLMRGTFRSLRKRQAASQ